MINQAIEALKARAIELTLAGITATLLSALLLLENDLAQYVSRIEPTMLIRIIAALVAITASSWIAFFYFKPRLKFDKHLQIYKDRKTDIPYCPSCKDGHNRYSKLIKNSGYWRCSVKECRMTYDDPDCAQPPNDNKPRGPAYG